MSRGNSSSYTTYRNGNVEYKVYSSFPGSRSQSTTYSFQNNNSDDSDSDEENEDIFSQLFNHHHRQSGNINNNNQNQHRSHSSGSTHNNTNQRPNVTLIRNNAGGYIQQLVQMIPLLFILFFVISPYLLSRY
jgi:hypothetical protein